MSPESREAMVDQGRSGSIDSGMASLLASKPSSSRPDCLDDTVIARLWHRKANTRTWVLMIGGFGGTAYYIKLDYVTSKIRKQGYCSSLVGPAARTHLLCYLVASSLASHALTKTRRVGYVVELAPVELARSRVSASRFDLDNSLKLDRARLANFGTSRQSDALTLFTYELTLNYQSPLVGRIWRRCSDALGAESLVAGA
jgi:hypothetical protein